MCRTGSHQDYHGLGMANLIFGIACTILPDHTAYSSDNFFQLFDSSTATLVSATSAITVINGLFLLVAGVLLLVIARRMVENTDYHRLTQVALVFLLISILISPITFALNVVSTNDASDDTFTPPTQDGNNSPAMQSLGFQNGTISLTTLFQLFMAFDRYADYRYGTSAALTLISAGCFFMNIACAIIITRQYNFRCFGRNAAPQPQMTEIVVANGDATRIQYQNQINDDRAIVIAPLPERPGSGGIHGHAHFQDASVPYRNPAFA
ncbi:hypothetical protein BV898_12350 [Hypsibius exemplaris]|uniref:Uncharacterized protein n=1 Tax=Hypsibius exemplaris TaxID=2072580 RepID=A0A1W0WDX9_HYPEX|nr:hypothetical protein BV898_12350 [Hypsibius exemplaris]